MSPIIYKANVESRFSDLDPYGHVNFKHFLDYVITSRLTFLQNRFNMSLEKLAKIGTGFYATEAQIKFLKPILGIKQLDIETYVESVIRDQILVIPFIIKDEKTSIIYAEGRLNFAVIDLRTGKPTNITEEIQSLFFE